MEKLSIQDFYDAIPNKEDVDMIFVSAVFARIQNLAKLSAQVATEEPTLVERSREGDPRKVKNPFWDVYKNEINGVRQDLAELNLTPKTRKSIMDKVNGGNMPKLD
jgi:hypothetical protein